MRSDEVLWDATRDSARLAAVLRRSGYSAEQFARLMDEVAAAEAAQAERMGLPGVDKIRGGVRRQTVERWARGESTPKGWSARLALVVVERLEGTLASGFESAGEPRSALARFGSRVRISWVAYLLALATVVGLIIAFGSTLGLGGSETPTTTTAAARTTPSTTDDGPVAGQTPAAAPLAVDGDPRAARGAGCDPTPAVAWWADPESPPLGDGMWFGRVLEASDVDTIEPSMIIDITCFYLGSDGGVVIDPPDQSLDSERAIRVIADSTTTVDWIDGAGSRVRTSVAEWLAGSTDESASIPVPCPGGRCSVWITMSGGVAREVVIVDF